MSCRALALLFIFVAMCAFIRPAHGEAMLQLFNVNWSDLTKKMPEIAEAGYDSLWLPNPARCGVKDICSKTGIIPRVNDKQFRSVKARRDERAILSPISDLCAVRLAQNIGIF